MSLNDNNSMLPGINISPDHDFETSDSEYHYQLYIKAKIAKWFFLVLFVVFFVIVITVFRPYITSENFKYMFKYLGTSNEIAVEERMVIQYTSDMVTGTVAFNGDIVTVDPYYVTFSRVNGEHIYSSMIQYSDPAILASDKYVLVFDRGGYSYSLYNSFSQIFTETLEYPITDAVISDSGFFAIVTRTQEARSAVYVYDKNLKLINRILKNRYIIDIDITKNGDEILIAYIHNLDGEYTAEILRCRTYEETVYYSNEWKDRFPLYAQYNADGYVLIFDTQIEFYDSENRLIGEFFTEDNMYSFCSVSDYYVLLAMESNNVFVVLDNNGKTLYHQTLDGRISRLIANQTHFYVAADTVLYRISKEDKTMETCKIDSTPNCMTVESNGNVVVGYLDKALIIPVLDFVSTSS